MARLSTHTIRAWEKRYKAVTHERSENGHRVYSDKEVQRLIYLAELTQFGSNISQIAHLKDEDLEALHQKLIKQGSPDVLTSKLINEIDLSATLNTLMDAVSSYKVDLLAEILSGLRFSLAPKRFALDILMPILLEAQLKKEQGSLLAAQVQALSAIIKFYSGTIIYSHIEKNINASKKFAITSLEEEPHNLLLLVSALLCCEHKKYFYYLNSNLPAESIIDAVTATQASILILTLPESAKDNRASFQLDKLITTLDPNVRVWVITTQETTKVKALRSNVTYITSPEVLDQMLSTER